jgi:acyl-CoA synthetase (AMP-forming)/AMP-acid ligase II
LAARDCQEVWRGLQKICGIEIYAGCGMSETCPVISTATPKEHMLDWEEDRLLDFAIKTGRPLMIIILKPQYKGRVTPEAIRRFMPTFLDERRQDYGSKNYGVI